MNITTYFGNSPKFLIDVKYDLAQEILLGAAAMCLFLNSRIRIEGLIIVLIAAIGFYVGRGFVVTVLTGGSGTFVVGGDHSPLGDRNYFAMVIWMIIPMLMWLSSYTIIFPKNKIFQLTLIAFALTSAITIVGTQSRGALVAAPVFFAFFFLQSRQKISFIIFGLMAALIVLFIAPQDWWDRMDTIVNYEDDGSALARLSTWEFAWNYTVNHPIFGGGFGIFSLNFNAEKGRWLTAHSIYFEVLAEHGFVGFFLFFSMMFGLVYSGFKIRRRCRPYPELAWAGDLGVKLSVSILLYLTAGAFLSVAFHPIAYDLAILAMAVIHVVNREIAQRENAVRGRYPNRRLSRELPSKNVDQPEGAATSALAPNADESTKKGPLSWRDRRLAATAEAEANAQLARDGGPMQPRMPRR